MTTKRKNSPKSKSLASDNTDTKKKLKTATSKAKKKTSPTGKTKSKTASFSRTKTKATKPKVKEVEVDSKVREIISKSAQKVTSDEVAKKESKAFTLDDVRSILNAKSKILKSDKKETVKTEKVKKVSSSKSSSKVKKITTASIDDILGFGTGVSAVPSKPIRDPLKVPSQWQEYYDELMRMRASLKGALGDRSSETIGASARESSGELSLNSSDAGTETFDRDVALSMVANEQEALNEIEDAIDRVFDGTFGICQETNKPIKKNRLKAVPFTRFSLEGQDLFEKRKIREGGISVGAFATISDSTLGVED
jgi:RNA polymerase-binding transcription factor DksA